MRVVGEGRPPFGRAPRLVGRLRLDVVPGALGIQGLGGYTL